MRVAEPSWLLEQKLVLLELGWVLGEAEAEEEEEALRARWSLVRAGMTALRPGGVVPMAPSQRAGPRASFRHRDSGPGD
jgi:hypothetical protein